MTTESELQEHKRTKKKDKKFLLCKFDLTQQYLDGLIEVGFPLQGVLLHGVYESYTCCIMVSANIDHSDEAGVTELAEAGATAAGEIF